jgi:osmoprotectant transport system ATP-binding protein
VSDIRLIDVKKHYGEHVALRRVTLEFASQQTHAIVGPSGCGKTTILKMILGLVTPDAGSVSVGEIPVVGESRAIVRQSTGYVIQEGGLFPHLTAESP